MSDVAQNAAPVKADLLAVQWYFVGILKKLSIGIENCVLSLCVCGCYPLI